MAQRVLVADDEDQMLQVISYILETEGYEVDCARDGVVALEMIQENTYDLAVIDVMMPRLDGIELCRRVRLESEMPVLLLTARTEREDVVAGLEAGADDYLGKPFHPRELALRVRAVLRRERGVLRHVFHVQDLTLDLTKQRASRGGEQIVLSALEWRILALLCEVPGSVVTWDRMLEEAWSVDQWSGGREMVKAAIYRLRMRLHDDASTPRYLETVRGVGYRLVTATQRSS